MSRLIKDGELVLYGFVGASFWDDGFSSLEVLDALAELGRDADIVVRLNSGGGYAHEGVSIYNAFKTHKGKVTIHVDGIAASSASLLAMGGSSVVMRKGTTMMIHDPSTIVMGTSADLDKAKNYLEKTGDQMAGIYADKSGDKPKDIRKEMKDELWLTASEAVARGFADSEAEEETLAVAAFEYGLYAHAPETLTALAKTNGWSLTKEMTRAKQAAAKASISTQTKETDMTEAEKAALEANAKNNGAAEAKARIKAIMNCPEAKGREALANHFAYETDLPADAATAALKAAPVATAAAAESEADKLAKMTTEEKAAAYEESRITGQTLPDGGGKPKAKAAISTKDIYAARRAV